MRQVNTDFAGDPEYEQFLAYTENKAYATAKSYKTSYRKLRNLLGKPIRETAQETLFKTIPNSHRKHQQPAGTPQHWRHLP
jgi:hypothetical protein